MGREEAGELQESEWCEVVERGGERRSGGDIEKYEGEREDEGLGSSSGSEAGGVGREA